jgi:hypothetical protein
MAATCIRQRNRGAWTPQPAPLGDPPTLRID